MKDFVPKHFVKRSRFSKLNITFLLFILPLVAFAQDTLIRWETPVNLSNDTVFNIHPWIEAQGSYVHAVWAELHRRVVYCSSTDRGVTWSSRRQLNDTITSCILPKLYLNNNNIHCIWSQDYLGAARLHYRGSTDFGQTWDSIITLWTDTGQPKSGIAGCGDSVYVVGNRSLDTSISFRKSTDNGRTWSQRHPILHPVVSLYDIGLVYNSGKIHMAYTRYDSAYYSFSSDGGNTWSNPYQLTPDPDAAKCRHIAAVDSGCLFVPWPDNKYSNGIYDDIILRRSTSNGLSWLPEQQITDHHLAHNDDISAANNDVYLVWDKASSGPLTWAIQFCASTNKGDTWWPIEDIFRCPSQSVLALAPSIAVSFPVLHVIWDHRRYDTLDIHYLRGTRLPVEIKTKNELSLDRIHITVFPNPFTSKTYIELVPYSNLTIFDASGRIVKHLKGGETVWCGENDKGELLFPGVYFIVPYGGKTLVKKVVFLRR